MRQNAVALNPRQDTVYCVWVWAANRNKNTELIDKLTTTAWDNHWKTSVLDDSLSLGNKEKKWHRVSTKLSTLHCDWSHALPLWKWEVLHRLFSRCWICKLSANTGCWDEEAEMSRTGFKTQTSWAEDEEKVLGDHSPTSTPQHHDIQCLLCFA